MGDRREGAAKLARARRRRPQIAESIRSDLRYAARTLWNRPAFTAAAVLTLAIGVGAATAVYTVADALLLRPLPVQDQERVVVLTGATRDGRFDNFPLLLPDASAFARRARSLERVEFFSSAGAHPIHIRDPGGGVVRLRQTLVSGGFFELLGSRPILGRTLLPEDDLVGAAPVVVLSHDAWQRYFSSDPRVLDRRLVMHESGIAHRIVGVMPPGLDFPTGTDIWAPVMPNAPPLGDAPAYAELSAVGRLRRGASAQSAAAELTEYFARPGAPTWHHEVYGVGRSLARAVVGDVRPAVLAFSGAAVLLLLVTCANVANLLLVGGMARSKEIAVRSALGADRWRVVRQLIAESTILAAGGGLLGAGIASLGVRAFLAMAPAGTPRLNEIHTSGTMVGAAVAMTSITTLLFALVPALLTSRTRLGDALRSGPRQSADRRLRRGTEALVVGQVALTLLVLSAAGLITRSLLKLERVDLELEPSRLLLAELSMPSGGFGDTREQLALLDRLQSRLRVLPGVVAVSPVLTPPFAGSGGITAQIPAQGQSEAEAARNPTVDLEAVSPDYFTTLGISLLRGRGFSQRDREGSLLVAIISESAARHYWPGEDPIGKRLQTPGDGGLTVVGVVADARYRNLRDPRPSVYIPLGQSSFPVAPATLALRIDADLERLGATLRAAVSEVDPNAAIVALAPFETYFDRQMMQPRLNVALLTIFAIAALLLAAVGLYGIMETMVRQRTRELGVRMAMGATAEAVGRLVVRRGMIVALAGIVLGVLGALAANRLLGAMLFDLEPTDPVTLAAVVALVLLVATMASLVPARRSARIDPMVALRAD